MGQQSGFETFAECLEKCIRNATKRGVRHANPIAQRTRDEIGITKSSMFEGGINELVNNFLRRRNRLTRSAFDKIKARISLHPWSSFSQDMAELEDLFEQYFRENAFAPRSQPTRSLNRPEAEVRFRSLLESLEGRIDDVGDIDFFNRMISEKIVVPHSSGNSVESINNCRLIKVGMKSARLKQEIFADLASYVTLLESFAAFRIENGVALDVCLRDMGTLANGTEHRLPALCQHLVGHQRQLLKSMYGIKVGDTLFAGLAYDAFHSGLKAGLIGNLPYEPGLSGDAALEYQLQGSPMGHRPSRFGGKSLEEILVSDVAVSIDEQRNEGAARLLFGLSRGFVGTDLTKAEKYLDRGFELLANATSFHPTARAKGLVLEGSILLHRDRGRNIGRIKDRLREAEHIYGINQAYGRKLQVSELLKSL